MKKLKWNAKWTAVSICVALVVAWAISFGVHIYRIYRLPESRVEITGTIVDNRYNNYISEDNLYHTTGDLVRIGDKLYYNYYGSYASYGLYEITSDGARRIQWDGYGPWAFLIGHEPMLYPIQEYNGKLLMNTFVDGNYYVYNREIKDWELAQERIQSYNEETRTFEESILFDGVSDIAYLAYQETSFGSVYRSNALTDLWVYTDEDGSKRIADKDVCSFYTAGEHIYYITSENDSLVLHMFDWATKTDRVVCAWADYSNMATFIIEDNQLIFMARHKGENTHCIYKMDLLDPTCTEQAIYTVDLSDPDSEYMFSFNVWDGMVYICTMDGLIACNLDAETHDVLCDKAVDVCYIVDDTWAYFCEFKSSCLWRVPQSGGDVELVLG